MCICKTRKRRKPHYLPKHSCVQLQPQRHSAFFRLPPFPLLWRPVYTNISTWSQLSYLHLQMNKFLLLLSQNYLKVALASCSSRMANRLRRSWTSACSCVFWSWLRTMKSSNRLAISSSRSVTCSTPKRSSANSCAFYGTPQLCQHSVAFYYTISSKLFLINIKVEVKHFCSCIQIHLMVQSCCF